MYGSKFSKEGLLDFIKKNQSYRFIIVMFMVEWCNPCKRMLEVFRQFLKMREEKDVFFLQINVEENPSLSKDSLFAVSTVPKTFIFQGGNLWKQFEGSTDFYNLKKILQL